MPQSPLFLVCFGRAGKSWIQAWREHEDNQSRAFCAVVLSCRQWCTLIVIRTWTVLLVVQSSAIGVIVAAIPPCSAIRFRNPRVPRYPPPARRAPCLLRIRGKCNRGVRRKVRHLDLGGCSAILARYSDSAGIPPGTKPIHAGKNSWGINFFSNTCGACIRTRANTGKYF